MEKLDILALHLKCLPRAIQMKKLNRILFETFVILLTRVWTVRSGCSWESSSQTNCVISCSSTYTFSGSETTEQVLEDLEQKWNQVIKKTYPNEFLSHFFASAPSSNKIVLLIESIENNNFFILYSC